MKMYKIIYTNTETNVRITEYAFASFARKRVFYLVQCGWAEVEEVLPLRRTLDTFKKCLRHETKW